MWDLIVSVPDHCLSFYFVVKEPLNASLLPMPMNKRLGRWPWKRLSLILERSPLPIVNVFTSTPLMGNFAGLRAIL